MKQNIKKELEEIIQFYGSLEVYNEEQRRCNMLTIETAIQANPFIGRIIFKNAMPISTLKVKPARRPFWLLKFFNQKA